MMQSKHFRQYVQELRKRLSTGDATERTYYPALQALLESVEDGIIAVNEPKRVACGAPDFIILKGQTPVGYVEAKDVGANLDEIEKSEQLDRYLEALNNLILTNYLEFRWYVEGKHRETAQLATVTRDGKIKSSREGVQAVADLFQRFFAQEVPTVGRPKELAERMAALAGMIRELIIETFEQEADGELHGQYEAFRRILIPDLSPHQFADMYAQTIAYGLFAARVRAPIGQPFTRQAAGWNLPPTNPFLRNLFNDIAGPGLDERVAWAVDDLAYLLDRADMAEVLRDFGKAAVQEDPVVHFYETFLGAYDPGMRQRRGVYYTPEPMVSYIVHSIDYLLRTHFDRPWGLADTATDPEKMVYVLDLAVGTATFLYFVVRQIHETVTQRMGQAGGWDNYVAKHLLPRLFGFELLMAPYAVAHLKLGMLLQETGYRFASGQRLGIYLTNTLEQTVRRSEALFAQYIADEADAAAHVKRDVSIMVVLGNPPYSVSSANKGEWIDGLMATYKAAVRDEQNIQPLSDDYIKFIRFAHDRVERTGHGIIGIITNHSHLSGLIHRGMREELMKSFTEIYVLNLHGSAMLGETAPDGSKDENVFDIRQGVAISLFVKKQEGEGLAQVKYADLWGLRDGKYRYLLESDASTTDWQELEPVPPYFFFVPKDFDLLSEYDRGWSVPDIFPVNSGGIKTHRDHFVIDFEEKRLRSRISAFRDDILSDDEVRQRFKLKDTQYWKLTEARSIQQARKDWEKNINRCLYRPFDIRPMYYSRDVIDRPRSEVMHHLLHENQALLAMRQVTIADRYTHFGVSRLPVDNRAFYSTRGILNVFPLYLYTTPEDTEGTLFAVEEVTRQPNLSPQFIAAVKRKLGLVFVSDGKGDLQTTFGPEDILHYAYAIFHSPTYRERYAEFLKIDFPRLPLTSDLALFRGLAEKGEELVGLHLMESPALGHLITSFPVKGSNKVNRQRYVEPRTDDEGREIPGRVYINKTQYFEGVSPEVWEFQIGGYQVLGKWLKDRRGRMLSFDELLHYQRIVVALKETMRLMEEIDDLIPSWPIE